MQKKVLSSAGEDGIDVDGTRIRAYQGKDMAFRILDNIAAEEDQGRIIYRAEKTGILITDTRSVSVVEELVITGDAGIESGNIRYEKDVIIKGNLCSGYSVESGGNVSIQGNIENGGIVRCKGNLYIGNGLFGENSDISVQGNCEVGFVQDSAMMVEGSIQVRNFVWQSALFSRAYITVMGKSMKGSNTSVVGGRLIAMKGMDLASVGSYNADTTLFCGYNPSLEIRERQLQKLVKRLDTLLLRVQNSCPVNLHDTEMIRRMIVLKPQMAGEIRKKLMQLRDLLAKKNRAEQAIEQTRQEMLSNESHLAIYIRKKIVPDLIVRMKNERRVFSCEATGMEIYLTGSGIHCKSYDGSLSP
ncbi:FapA family protein [Chitinivibrio alkaliphilus]|uniref:Serine/threonine protein kinase n=1 Tax=Chitinivibrio alkaliphilus ACht1 TaxID=1313304 RepID=U7D8L9_9BACT|nr:FapA family protein [Chitinivibrio alkaliphilus]ERP31437.1 serine/threonine protein kinase [Chitinivibrio alkaliphilus ACht1]